MFSSIGWGEILVIAVIAFLIIGPERLPKVIKELKAVRLAIKNAVGEARKQLDGEFGDEIKNLAEPIKDVAEPIQQLSSLKGMSAKSLVTRALFDGDSSDLDAAEAAVNKPLTTMATKTPKRALQDFFDSPTPPAAPAQTTQTAAPVAQSTASAAQPPAPASGESAATVPAAAAANHSAQAATAAALAAQGLSSSPAQPQRSTPADEPAPDNVASPTGSSTTDVYGDVI